MNNALQRKGCGVIQELFVREPLNSVRGILFAKSASLVPRLFLNNVILLLSLPRQAFHFN